MLALDFTVAITPETTSLDREISYIKSSILYADKINLISPLAYLFLMMTTRTQNSNEKKMIQMLRRMLPFIKEIDREMYEQGMETTKKLSEILSKRYNNIPLVQRIGIKNQLRITIEEMANQLFDTIGLDECQDLQNLINNNQLNILKFEHGFESSSSITTDFCKLLTQSLNNSYPLFDELSNNIMKQALEERIVTISPIEREKFIHTGLVNNYMQRLPSFECVTFSELIDIKEELRCPLINFRSKMHKYSESIKTAPWDDDFAQECNVLYNKEVAPTLLELEEATKDNSFRKNLGNKFFTEEGLWKSYGFLVVGIAATGVIPCFNEAISNEQALISGAVNSGAFVVSKLIAAYNDYKDREQTITNNDLFFYYKVNKELSKKYSR